MSSSDFHIQDIEQAFWNGRRVKIFTAYINQGDAWVYHGRFTAPVATPDKSLWRIAERDGEDDEDAY